MFKSTFSNKVALRRAVLGAVPLCSSTHSSSAAGHCLRTSIRCNSYSDYTPVDGDLYLQQKKEAAKENASYLNNVQADRMRKRRMSMFEEISGAFSSPHPTAGGGAPSDGGVEGGSSSSVSGGGLEATGYPEGVAPPRASNQKRFSASDEEESAATATTTNGSSSSATSASSASSLSNDRLSINGWQSSPLVTYEESPLPGVYIIRLNNPPVNTCTLEVLRGLLYCLTTLATTFENDVQDAAKPNPWDPRGNTKMNRCRGVILHSSVANIFSAGMDLDQLLTVGADAEAERIAAGKPSENAPAPPASDPPSILFDPTTHTPDGKRIPYAAFVQYWGTLQHFHFTLLGYPVPVVSAISGDAPAGGCLMGMLSDYRVMAAKKTTTPSSLFSASPSSQKLFRIGMTSVKAGFAVPPWIAALLSYTVGPKHAEEILTMSRMVTAEEAKEKYGLIDQVSESDETVLLDALAAMEFLLANIPFQHTFWHVKESCRRPLLDMLETRDKRLDDVSRYISHLSNSEVYRSMRAYKDGLGSGKRK